MPDDDAIFRAAQNWTRILAPGDSPIRISIETVGGKHFELEVPPTHSPDFRSIFWAGRRFTFSHTQAAIVEILFNAWANGSQDVGQAYLLEEAGSEPSGKIQDLFRESPAWGTLIVAGENRGTWRLQRPVWPPAA